MLGGVIQGSVDLLAELKGRGVRLYAPTNWSHETFPHAMEIGMFDFLHWFEGIVVSGEERLIKPDPRIYRRLFERYAMTPRGRSISTMRDTTATRRQHWACMRGGSAIPRPAWMAGFTRAGIGVRA